jgi:hypothetical protein
MSNLFKLLAVLLAGLLLFAGCSAIAPSGGDDESTGTKGDKPGIPYNPGTEAEDEPEGAEPTDPIEKPPKTEAEPGPGGVNGTEDPTNDDGSDPTEVPTLFSGFSYHTTNKQGTGFNSYTRLLYVVFSGLLCSAHYSIVTSEGYETGFDTDEAGNIINTSKTNYVSLLDSTPANSIRVKIDYSSSTSAPLSPPATITVTVADVSVTLE